MLTKQSMHMIMKLSISLIQKHKVDLVFYHHTKYLAHSSILDEICTANKTLPG